MYILYFFVLSTWSSPTLSHTLTCRFYGSRYDDKRIFLQNGSNLTVVAQQLADLATLITEVGTHTYMYQHVHVYIVCVHVHHMSYKHIYVSFFSTCIVSFLFTFHRPCYLSLVLNGMMITPPLTTELTHTPSKKFCSVSWRTLPVTSSRVC